MSDPRYCRNAGSVYSLKYSKVWYPKYRREAMVGEIADELRWLLFEQAQALDVEQSGGNVSRWGERCLKSRYLLGAENITNLCVG